MACVATVVATITLRVVALGLADSRATGRMIAQILTVFRFGHETTADFVNLVVTIGLRIFVHIIIGHFAAPFRTLMFCDSGAMRTALAEACSSPSHPVIG
jgi:hypothetical protein